MPAASQSRTGPLDRTSKANARTLCVDREGCVLEAQGGKFIYRESDSASPLSLPAVAVRQIFISRFGRVRSSALRLALTSAVPVTFFGKCGEMLGHLQPGLPPRVDLRLAQYRAHGDARVRLAMARRIVISKLESCHALLQSRNRRLPGVRACLLVLERAHRDVSAARNFDSLRGFEGIASKRYFAAFGECISPGVVFNGRSRRPPADPLNALLSYGYSVLARDLAGKLELAGLDPYVGFLHEPGYRNPALALDLCEPLRASLIDRIVLDLIDSADPSDFEPAGDGMMIGRELKRSFFTAYETALRLRTTTQSAHPGGSLLEEVATELVTCLRDNRLPQWKPLPEICRNHLS